MRVIDIFYAECKTPIYSVVLIAADIYVEVADIAFLIACEEVVGTVVAIVITVNRINDEGIPHQVVHLGIASGMVCGCFVLEAESLSDAFVVRHVISASQSAASCTFLIGNLIL